MSDVVFFGGLKVTMIKSTDIIMTPTQNIMGLIGNGSFCDIYNKKLI